MWLMKAFDALYQKIKKSTHKLKKESKNNKKFWRNFLFVFGIIFSVFALFIIFLILEEFIYQNRAFPNLEVAGVKLEKNLSLSKLQLENKINLYKENGYIIANYGQRKWELKIQKNIHFDLENSLEKAQEYGRKGNYSEQLLKRAKLLFQAHNLNLDAKINDSVFTAYSDSIKKEIEYPASNASLKFENLNLLDIEAKKGLEISELELRNTITQEIAQLKTSSIQVPITTIEPQIIQTDNASVRRKALIFISKNITLDYINNHHQDEVEFQPEEIVTWILFNEKTYPKKKKPQLVIELDEEKLKSNIQEKIGFIETEPENVRLSFENNKLNVINASKNGYGINYKKLKIDLEKALSKTENRHVSVELAEVLPEITEKNLNKLGIKEKIAEGMSSFAGSSYNRSTNIRVGAEKFNGYLIKPGEEFSLNTILGPVDAEHGFVPELVIKENKTVPEYGGGLCQVATTMFRSALLAGLPITERRNHAYRVTYYDWPYGPGVDATIYSPHPDVKFINDTNNYILIQTRILGTRIFFDFYGTKTKEGKITSLQILWQNPDRSMATSFNREIHQDGKLIKTDTFKSIYKSPDLYPKPTTNQ